MPDAIRILVTDDHAVVRKGLVMVLRQESDFDVVGEAEQESDFDVVGEAENGRVGLEAARSLNPDIAIIDLIMPEMDGQEMALALRKSNPDIKIIMLTGTEVDDRVYEMVAAGVEGYVLKNIEPGELVRAIRAVANGESYLHPDVMKRILAQTHMRPTQSVTLTPRELEVLEWMTTPNTYKQIGAQLNVSEETIRSHAKNILEKLKQPNRTQAVLAAVKMGLVELNDQS